MRLMIVHSQVAEDDEGKFGRTRFPPPLLTYLPSFILQSSTGKILGYTV